MIEGGYGLALMVGADGEEQHRLDLDLDPDGLIHIAVDGLHRASVLRSEMLGGYAFSLGEDDPHRVEIFYIPAHPPRLEARVDGRRLTGARQDTPRRFPYGGALVLSLGLAYASLGIVSLAAAPAALVRLGFGVGTLALGGLLAAISPWIWLNASWACWAVLSAAALELTLYFPLSHDGARTPFIAPLLVRGSVVILLGIIALAYRVRERPPPPAERVVLEEPDEVIGRCPVHGGFVGVECARCGRMLCEECDVFRQAEAIVCDWCVETRDGEAVQ